MSGPATAADVLSSLKTVLQKTPVDGTVTNASIIDSALDLIHSKDPTTSRDDEAQILASVLSTIASATSSPKIASLAMAADVVAFKTSTDKLKADVSQDPSVSTIVIDGATVVGDSLLGASTVLSFAGAKEMSAYIDAAGTGLTAGSLIIKYQLEPSSSGSGGNTIVVGQDNSVANTTITYVVETGTGAPGDPIVTVGYATATVLRTTPEGYIIANPSGGSPGFVGSKLVTQITQVKPMSQDYLVSGEETLNADGSSTITAYDANGISTKTYDSTDRITSASHVNDDGSYEADVYNPDNGQLVSQKISYTDGSYSVTYNDPDTGAWQQTRTFDKDGNIVREDNSPGITGEQFAANMANVLADQIITQFIFKNDLPAAVAAQAFTHAGIDALETYYKGGAVTAENFAKNVAANLTSMAGSMIQSELTADLLKALGITSPIGAAIGNVAVTAATQQLANYIGTDILGLTGLSNNVLDGSLSMANFVDSLGDAFETAGLSLATSIVTSRLEHILEPNGNPQDAAAGGAIGSVIGAGIGSIFPGVGTIIGSILGNIIGTLIGGLFGHKSVGPNAAAGDTFNLTTQTFSMTASGEDNNGPLAAVRSMDTAKVQVENSIIKSIGGKVTNVPPISVVGYIGGHYYFVWNRLDPQNSFPNQFSDAMGAINFGVIQTLKALNIQGGDPYMEYALAVSKATTVDDLASDLNAAADYSKYIAAPLAFDTALALSTDPTQLKKWQAEYARAVQLGLTKIPTTIVNNTLSTSAANVVAAIDLLPYLVTSNRLSTIKLTDGGTPTITITAVQAANDSAALNEIAGPHAVVISDAPRNVGSEVITSATGQKTTSLINAAGTPESGYITITKDTGDVIIGDGNMDTYAFNAGSGHVLIENSWAGRYTSNSSTLSLLNLRGTPTFLQVGDDLVVDILGSSDRITMQNWFTNTNTQLAYINSGSYRSTIYDYFWTPFRNLPTYTTAAFYNATPQLAHDAYLLSQITGAMSLTFNDTAAHIIADLDNMSLLASQGKLQTIHLTDGGTALLQVTVDQLKNYGSVWSKINNAYSFVVGDSATNISANFDLIVATQAQNKLVSAISTDAHPVLWLTVAQALSAQTFLSKLGSGIILDVNDTALNIAAHLDALQALVARNLLASITLTDVNTPDLAITFAQLTNDAGVLSKIVSPANYVVSGTSVDLVTNLVTLNNLLTQGKLDAIHLTDNGVISGIKLSRVVPYANVFAAVTTPLHLNIVGMAANIQASFDTIGILAAQGQVASITFSDAAPVLQLSAIQATQTDTLALQSVNGPFSLIISDTAAHISANINAIEVLALHGTLTAINLTDGDTPNLSFTAQQFLTDSNIIAKIKGTYTETIIADANMTETLTGTGSVNTVSFANETQAVRARLNLGTATTLKGTTAYTDTLKNIQKIIGTSYDDTLVFGSTGNQTLSGNGGSDIYKVAQGSGANFISNFVSGGTIPSGELDFGVGIISSSLSFAKIGNDLVVSVNGATDKVTVLNWFGAASAQLSKIQTTTSTGGLTPRLTNASGVLTLITTAAQISADTAMMDKIAMPYRMVVSDTSANILANLNLINTFSSNAKIAAVYITDTTASTLITALYQGILGRAPTATELSNYQNQLITGTSVTTMESSLAYSAEAQSNIIASYQTFFGVAPNATVLSTLTSLLTTSLGLLGVKTSLSLASLAAQATKGISSVTGSETSLTYNYTAGGSQVQSFNPTNGVATKLQYYNGTNATATLTNTTYNLAVGNDGALSLSNSTVNLGASSQVALNGSHDIVTVGAASTLVIANTSSANTVNAAGATANVTDNAASDVVTLQGASDNGTLSGTGSQIILSGINTSAQLSGTAEYASLTGSNAQITVTGASNNINLSGTGEYVAVSGDNNQAVLGGSTNNITVTGAKGWVGLQGDHNNAVLNGTGNQIAISGTNATAQLAGTSQYALLTGANAQISITGSTDGAELKGTGEIATISGNNNQVVLSGTQSLVTVTGANNWAGIQGDSNRAVISGTGSQVALSGKNGRIRLNGANEVAIMTGSGNTIIMAGTNESASFGVGGGQTINVIGTNDVLNFAKGDGADTINNGLTSGNPTATNELDFGAGIATNQLWFQRSGNNLEIDVMGTKDSVTIANWYTGSAAQLQTIKTADGNVLDNKVSQLVQAMASYSVAHAAFNPATTSVMPGDAALQQAVATSWHH